MSDREVWAAVSAGNRPPAGSIPAGFSRRTLLAGGAATLGGLALFLAGCGSGGGATGPGAPAAPSALPGGTPRRGGTFTVGVQSAGDAENLYPGTATYNPDMLRSFSLFSFLFYPGPRVTPLTPGLALSADRNENATVWTFTLRPGVTWHDGKPFTAADVAYNFTTLWADPTSNYSAAFLAGLVDTAKVKVIDATTLEVPLLTPVAQFPTLLTYFNFGVVQEGATLESIASNPIGTGPFKFESFTPGRQSVFVRNENYWEEGKPYVDKLVIDSSFTDTTALTNALIGGQINILPSVDLIAARQQVATRQFQVLQSEFFAQQAMFAMRVDEGPFADVRVRQAFRLLCDRQALIDGALAGFGTPNSDVLGPGAQYYASDLVRTPDVEKAKSLLAEAGAAGATFTLQTTPLGAAFQQAATLFAEQAREAGVDVQLEVTDAATYFTPAGGVYEKPFRQNLFQPLTGLTGEMRGFLTKDAPYKDTHWGEQRGGEAALALIDQAVAEVDDTKAADLWRQVQQQQFDEGGYLIWADMPYVDAAANNVRGLTATAGLNFNNWRLCDGWLE